MAVELGYGITVDAGPSGNLRHWRIAGIPDEILQLHSKRAAEITAAVAAEARTATRPGKWLPGPPEPSSGTPRPANS
jgi:hypothetical protein